MKRDNDEINFWQSFTDILSAILLVIMLVSVLLILYLMQAPEEQWTGYEQVTATPSPTFTPEFGDGDFDDGGIWYTPTPEISVTPTVTVTPTPTPTPFNPDGGGHGGGGDPYGDMGKAAVYAMIVDEETNRVIPKEGIVFELFDLGHVRQTLNTYYPERVWYHDFTTTEAGTFYLPEKVALKGYYLRTDDAPEGYDNAENAYFTLDEAYDWPAPYVVKIPFAPSKNVINVTMVDADTGDPVSGGIFRVVAAEDIVTPDGTLRYAKGDVADTIVCDEEGKGQSIELYLGDYTVEQANIPKYYAGFTQDDTVTVRKKASYDTAVYMEYNCRKSTMIVTARDALYNNLVLEGAEFAVFREGGELNVELLSTDKLGQVVLTNLEKDSVYHLRQTASLANYNYPPEEYTFTVDERGWVNDAVVANMDVTNHIVRVSLTAVDALLRNSQSDISMGLYDVDNNQVKLWATSAMPETLQGLQPGRYYLVLNGNLQERKMITVEDTMELQSFAYSIWSGTDTLVVIGGVAVLCGVTAYLIKLRKKKTPKKDKE